MNKKTNIEKVSEMLAEQSKSYAARFQCSLIEAIADRDYPVTSEEVEATLKLLNLPVTEQTIEACHPSTLQNLEAWQAEESQAYER